MTRTIADNQRELNHHRAGEHEIQKHTHNSEFSSIAGLYAFVGDRESPVERSHLLERLAPHSPAGRLALYVSKAAEELRRQINKTIEKMDKYFQKVGWDRRDFIWDASVVSGELISIVLIEALNIAKMHIPAVALADLLAGLISAGSLAIGLRHGGKLEKNALGDTSLSPERRLAKVFNKRLFTLGASGLAAVIISLAASSVIGIPGAIALGGGFSYLTGLAGGRGITMPDLERIGNGDAALLQRYEHEFQKRSKNKPVLDPDSPPGKLQARMSKYKDFTGKKFDKVKEFIRRRTRDHNLVWKGGVAIGGTFGLISIEWLSIAQSGARNIPLIDGIASAALIAGIGGGFVAGLPYEKKIYRSDVSVVTKTEQLLRKRIVSFLVGSPSGVIISLLGGINLPLAIAVGTAYAFAVGLFDGLNAPTSIMNDAATEAQEQLAAKTYADVEPHGK